MTSVRHASGCVWTCADYLLKNANYRFFSRAFIVKSVENYKNGSPNLLPVLKQANEASIDQQIGLGSCSMHKWMKGNVWRIKNVKRVSVKPEKNIVKFLKYCMKYFMKYFKAKNFVKFYITNGKSLL